MRLWGAEWLFWAKMKHLKHSYEVYNGSFLFQNDLLISVLPRVHCKLLPFFGALVEGSEGEGAPELLLATT